MDWEIKELEDKIKNLEQDYIDIIHQRDFIKNYWVKRGVEVEIELGECRKKLEMIRGNYGNV